jgi:hypothetical protein
LPGVVFVDIEPLFALTVIHALYVEPLFDDHRHSLIVLSAVQLRLTDRSSIDAVKAVIAAYLGMVVRGKFPLIVIVPGETNTPP